MTRIPNDMLTNNYRRVEELSGRKDPAAMKAVSKEMEAMFAYEMIKAMRSTVSSSSKDNLGGGTFTAMFDMELSKVLADRGLGMQDMLYKAMMMEAQKAEQSATGKQPTVPTIPTEGAYAGAQAGRPEPQSTADPLTPGPQTSSLPVNGQVSSGFGVRKHPISGHNQFHHGMDIAAPFGNEIRPIRDGEVAFSGAQPGYGNVVIVDHGNGLISKYAHNSLNLVKEGDKVDSKTVIARVGSTGYSTGPHLHLEVRYKGESINPAGLIAKV